MGAVIFVVVVILLAIFGFKYYNVLEKKRTEQLRATAADLGLDFAPTDNANLHRGFVGLRLFMQGRSKLVKNIAYGRIDNAEVMLFDYSYTTGTGKSRVTLTQTVAFFQTDRLMLPEFILRPENMFDKIGQVFGQQDIDLPMHPEFSKLYLLKGADEAAIRKTFTGEVARFFESNRRLSVEAQVDRFILYKPNGRLKPEQWRERLTKGRETLGILLRN